MLLLTVDRRYVLRGLLNEHRRLMDFHHRWLVVWSVSLCREDRALGDRVVLLRLDKIDLDGLLLVCVKEDVLLIVIIIMIMTLVVSQIELDLYTQKREQ